MVELHFSWREMVLVAATLAICLIPVVAATILAYRSFRRGWWLAGPGGLFALFVPAAWLMLFGAGAADGDDRLAFGIAMALFVGTWVALGVFLAALAIVGPRSPTLDVNRVF